MSQPVANRRLQIVVAALALAAAGVGALLLWPTDDVPPPATPAPLAEPPEPAREPEAAALPGMVTDRETLQGIEGASVTLSCGDDEPDVRVTDVDGLFSWEAAPPGRRRCQLSAAAPGYVVGGPSSARPVKVSFGPDGTAPEVRLQLSRAARVRGKVIDAGQPVPAATLTVLYLETDGEAEPWSETSNDLTAADGTFDIPALVAGRLQLLAEHEDYGLAESQAFYLHPGELREGLVITLSAASMVHVTVLDDRGDPVHGATVRLVPPGTTQPVMRRTDESGLVLFDPVSTGEVLVSVDARGFQPVRRRRVAVPAGEEVDVTVDLTRRSGFGGVVLAPDGTPVPRAAVHVVRQGDTHVSHGQATARTDRYGRFWIESVRTYPTQVVASHPDWRHSDVVGIVADGADVELRLRAGGRIVGRVVDSRGRGVHGFRIRLLLEGGRQRRGGGASRIERLEDGRFEIPSIAPGTYTVRASGAGRLPASVEGAEVASGEVTDVGTLVLEGGGAAIGRLVDAETGDPLRGAVRVTFSGYGRGAEGASARAGEDGTFRIEGLWPQRMTLRAMSPGYVTRMVSGVDPAPGDTIDLGDIPMTARTGGRNQIQYSGVGAQLRMTKDGIALTKIFDGSPAMDAGLEPGAIIVGINGQDAGDYDLRRAVELIRGETGTAVELEIIPPDGGHPELITVERREVTTS